jgi:hypothetical protein
MLLLCLITLLRPNTDARDLHALFNNWASLQPFGIHTIVCCSNTSILRASRTLGLEAHWVNESDTRYLEYATYFDAVTEHAPSASAYGFMNGDLLWNGYSLSKAIMAVANYTPFLLTGVRYNIPKDINLTQPWTGMLLYSSAFAANAQDYFIWSKGFPLRWKEFLPRSRIGGVIFDNWLTALPRNPAFSFISAIDLSDSVYPLHLSDPDGPIAHASHSSHASTVNREIHRLQKWRNLSDFDSGATNLMRYSLSNFQVVVERMDYRVDNFSAVPVVFKYNDEKSPVKT